VTVPAFGTQAAARSVTTNYRVGNNPRVTSVTDPAGTITTTVDLLGRVKTYTDVWNQTTTTVYDQTTGRVSSSSGPVGPQTFTYDRAGRVTAQTLDGAAVATPTYETAGTANEFALASVAYSNGTSVTNGRNTLGTVNSLTWKQGATTLATDAVTKVQDGRTTGNTLTWAPTATAYAQTYRYDTVGRLTRATVPGSTIDYNYAATPACTAATSSNLNSNKSSIVTTPTTGTATTQSFCYDAADRLASSTGLTTLNYDTRGNTATVNGDLYGYDGANRHTQTINNTAGTGPVPTHRATTAASNAAGATSVTLTKPTTAVAGDVLVASVAAADRAAVPVTTLSNSGFEKDVWAGASTSTTTSEKHLGLNSLSVNSSGVQSNVSFTAGVVNTLSGWMKGTGTVSPTIEFYTSTWSFLGSAAPPTKVLSATAWGQWTTTYTPPAGTGIVLVKFAGAANPWYLDDVIVTTGATTLSNIGFEIDVWVGSLSTNTSAGHSGPTGLTVGSQVRSNVSFTAGVVNNLSGWMKGDLAGTGTVSPTIQFYGPTWSLLGSATAPNLALSSGTWQQWSGSYTPPTGTSFVQVTFNYSDVNIWTLDDVIVTTGTGTATPTTVTVPAGWAPATTSSTAGVTLSTFTHTVAAGDPVSWAFGLSQSVKAVGSISAYSGVDTTTPIDVTATGTNVSGTAHVAPSVTTTGVNRLGLMVTAATAVTSMTPPVGSTERADQAGSAGAPTATIETSDFPQAATGATGTKTTVTAAAATSTVATLTLRPASSGGTTKVSYVRDVTNRIVERKVNDVTVARYTFSSGGDSPDAELDVTNVIQRRTIGLMGGAVLSKATGSEIWSITNLHDDTIATLGATGVVTGGPFTYDPFGQTINGAPDNQIGLFDNGWLGKNQRPLEQQTGLRAVIEMGARIYDSRLARFLSLDPVEGGTSNAYAYVDDPINAFDQAGSIGFKKWWRDHGNTVVDVISTVGSIGALGACIVATAGVCLGATLVAGAIAVGADTQKDVVSPLMHNKSVNWATFGKHVAFDVVTTYVGVKAPAVRAPVSGRFLGGVKNARTFSAALRFGSNYARVATLGVLRGFGQLGSFLLGKCRWF
jgi:RHS repeat-associated protein